MEENVALDSKKQKKFVKSIQGIKKLIKKNEEKVVVTKKDDDEKPKIPFSMRLKGGKINKNKKNNRKEKGLVYLSHIPHGFYEHEMTEYFKQFGGVTNARVIRSKRTGKSKGYAFVEFRDPSVGQIVAETMNNYLMGKRLLKAAYIPPEKQRRAFRKNWNAQHNPSAIAREKNKKSYNMDRDQEGEVKRAKKLLTRLHTNQKKLKALGIDYDFFTPVDVPEALLDKIVKKEDSEENEDKKDIKNKKNVKVKQEVTKKDKIVQNGKQKEEQTNGLTKKNGKKTEATKKIEKPQPVKKEKVPEQVNKKVQKEKEKKLKDAGVKAPEFIEVGNESDSSVDFDSDEYDQMLAEYGDGSDVSDDDNDSNDGNDDDESEPEAKPVKKPKAKSLPKAPQVTKTPVVPTATGKVNKNKNRRRSQKKGKKPVKA